MSSRNSKDDKEYRSGRDRSRSRSPRKQDDDNPRRKEKDYNKIDYENNHKKYEESYKPGEIDHKKAEIKNSKLLEPNTKKRMTFGLTPKNNSNKMSIQMKLGGSSNKPKLSVPSAFNEDSDEEPEEMPPEARMRMKNIGRNTPTSSGPNSFGKTKQGFSDAKKVFERTLKEAMDAARADD